MKNILLPINYKYVKKIINKKKLYEIRGWIWKNDVKYVYIYCSKKIKKIVVRFEVGNIIIMDSIDDEIISKYKDKIGVSYDEIAKYQKSFNYKQLYLIEIKNLQVLKEDNYINLDKISLIKAPQKFKYLNVRESEILKRYFGE